MPNLTYDYVYLTTGPHTRQPRPSGTSNGFTLLQSVSGGTLSSGDNFAPGILPNPLPVNGQNYNFVFASVTGGTPQGQVTFANTQPPSITVGSSDITVLAVYTPAGGGGGGPKGAGSGATIDSFDTTTGSLFDDTFVTVAPDPTGALTKSGNVDGYVDTSGGTLTITAISPTSPSKVDFQRWVNFSEPGLMLLPLPFHGSNPAELAAPQGQSLTALAFYASPPTSIVQPPDDPCLKAFEQLSAIVGSGDRPRIPPAEVDTIKAQLEKCVAEGKLSQASVTDLINAYDADLGGPPSPSGPLRLNRDKL